MFHALPFKPSVSKWLTMRELIRAEERLLFARHDQSQTRSIRRIAESVSRSENADNSSAPRCRSFPARKELY